MKLAVIPVAAGMIMIRQARCMYFSIYLYWDFSLWYIPVKAVSRK